MWYNLVVTKLIMAEAKAEKVAVLDKYGNVIREYTKEVHGAKFEELAKEFASKDKKRSLCK